MEKDEIIKRLERQNYLMEKRYEILKGMICDIYDEIVIQKRICPVCKNEIRGYIPYGKPKMRYHAQCPMCYSVERERLLSRYLELNWTSLFGDKTEKIKILEFAPGFGLYQRFKNMSEVDYYPVDINPDYPLPIIKIVDITNITYEDSYFDLIICYHVLANVLDEKKALQELKRVLKKKEGVLLIADKIDFDLENTLEDERWNTSELREEHYGHKDYQRLYGNDYDERIKVKGGFSSVEKYEAESFHTAEEMQYYSLMYHEALHVCKK